MTPTYEFRFQRGTAARWTQLNPTLGAGEPGVEVDTGKLKIGDSATAWNDLDYFLTEPLISNLILSEFNSYDIPFYVPFGRNGDLITFTGPRLYFPEDSELVDAIFSVTTAPSGSDATFEILKNGLPIFSVNPSIPDSNYTSLPGTLTGVTIFSAQTDYLQVQCTQIGSIAPGANLSVVLKMIPA
jgi:hypothetical protein